MIYCDWNWLASVVCLNTWWDRLVNLTCRSTWRCSSRSRSKWNRPPPAGWGKFVRVQTCLRGIRLYRYSGSSSTCATDTWYTPYQAELRYLRGEEDRLVENGMIESLKDNEAVQYAVTWYLGIAVFVKICLMFTWRIDTKLIREYCILNGEYCILNIA